MYLAQSILLSLTQSGTHNEYRYKELKTWELIDFVFPFISKRLLEKDGLNFKIAKKHAKV